MGETSKKQGGNRINSGAPLKYGEPIVRFHVCVPESKKEELVQIIKEFKEKLKNKKI